MIGFAAGSIPRLPANQILLGNRCVVGVELGAWARRNEAEHRALLGDIVAWPGPGRSIRPSR